MKILYAASEAYPFIKTGGLADVSYALPKALRKLGIDIRIILPKYGNISSNFKNKMKNMNSYNVPVGWRNQYCGLQYLEYEGIPFYFIDNEYYFKRTEAYGFYDDGERFSYFCRAVLESIEHMDNFIPDIIHCNDWHTAMIPLLLKEHFKSKQQFSDIRTIFTIHNLKYQGVFSKSILGELLDLSEEYFSEDSIKFHDGVSFMKAGINYSDIITTVSKSYAEEIKYDFYGEGLQGVIRENDYKLQGIVNGIDYELFNPKTDKIIKCKYDLYSIKDKAKNKIDLQKILNLPVNKNTPVIGIVSRLVKQKGLELIAFIIEELLSMDVQLVLLGTGEEDYEDLFKYYSTIYPSKLSSNIFFDNVLAEKIYAGADMFLMPSLFEPCGISQLISLRYGTVPIVRETGGLKDTVIPYNEYTDEGNGFSFKNYNAHEMLDVIRYAIEIYRNKNKWKNLMINGMKTDSSWENSAKRYSELYSSLK
ncbi:glycogen synthase GlgA [Clostridium aestuarii]|uniref:Glycogen synthase n=1 Tax=Clostridium aestuarii TaxID=338193 RepID=A0ABT4CY11_9CLOT|nr:glycogen synthase GlgA [Clostridium aestuarii]MCY6483869.1 glycogen synthase GlgA [Clostridium aestuarii]